MLPGIDVLKSPSLPSLDYGWAFRHPTAGLILFGLLLIFGTALVAWIAERVEQFKAKVAQGFAAFRDRSYYLRHVVPWQLLDWTLRLVTVFFFLRAFGIPATLHNALLVQVSQSLATILPVSPAGIGTEQALLVYVFRNVDDQEHGVELQRGHARHPDRRQRCPWLRSNPAHDRDASHPSGSRSRSRRLGAGAVKPRTAASRDRPRNRPSTQPWLWLAAGEPGFLGAADALATPNVTATTTRAPNEKNFRSILITSLPRT